MPPSPLSRFLRYRFAAHILWPALLLGTAGLAIAATGSIQLDSVRMMVVWASVALAFFVGRHLQQRLLFRLDPDGTLRQDLRAVHERGTHRG
jgi:membrane protein DedA with SNARE-associated domain